MGAHVLGDKVLVYSTNPISFRHIPAQLFDPINLQSTKIESHPPLFPEFISVESDNEFLP